MTDGGRRRLWIGNLDERISEFSLLKVLQKYGKIEQFDFLFHKSGPNQGKPRGYCFISFENKTDAVHALHSLDGKLALGKKLAVKWAHSHIKAPNEPVPLEPVINLHPDKIPSSFGGQSTKVPEETITKKKPIHTSVAAQIRAIEGKLREMEKSSASSTFKPVPVYAAKKPPSPKEITEKCLPSLMSLPVELPPPSSSTTTTTSSSSTSTGSPPSTAALHSSPTSLAATDSHSSSAAAAAPSKSSSASIKSLVVMPTGKSKTTTRQKPYDKR